MSDEKCSVIIPVFNAEDTIEEAIHSVLNGTYSNVELLVVDDCSTDNSRRIVDALAKQNNKIRHIKSNKNQGGARTRNLAIEYLSGKYVAFLDSDDLWEPEKLEKCISLLEANPEIKAVAHDMKYLTEKGEKVGYIQAKPRSRDEQKHNNENGIPPIVFTSTAVLHADALIKEGGFDENWVVGQDTEFFSRVAQKYGLLVLNEPLGSYRLRGGSLTGSNWLKKRLARRCVIENNLRQREGRPPISLDQYMIHFKQNTPLLEKAFVMRQALSRQFWRQAGEAWLNKKSVFRTFFLASIGSLLDPATTVYRVRRWLKSRV
jgi:glycosyltransferase involved in cell wall biosynthesis